MQPTTFTKMNDASFFTRSSLTSPLYKCAEISCAVIAGGKSSRFGTDKALAHWHGDMEVMESVISTASSVFKEVFIVGGAEKYQQRYGISAYNDIIGGHGPLSGIHTALTLSSAPAVMILACDMPAISAEFLKYICSIPTWAPVVAPESSSGVEPLHALWHVSLAYLIENQLRKRRTGARQLLKKLPCRIITLEEATGAGLDPYTLSSVNTPEALKRLRRKMRLSEGGTMA